VAVRLVQQRPTSVEVTSSSIQPKVFDHEGVLYQEHATYRPQLGTTKIEDFGKTFAAA